MNYMFSLPVCEGFVAIVERKLGLPCYYFSVLWSVREVADVCVVVDEYVGLLFG